MPGELPTESPEPARLASLASGMLLPRAPSVAEVQKEFSEFWGSPPLCTLRTQGLLGAALGVRGLAECALGAAQERVEADKREAEHAETSEVLMPWRTQTAQTP